jgi:alkylation response protein AidB-like acyl-CoA dehydrogenase
VIPPTPAHEILRREVREFLAEAQAAGHFRPHISGWMHADKTFSRLCGLRGYIGMTWPIEYGGKGRSSFERYIVTEELLASGAPVGAHWIADRQSGPQILRHGSEALRRRVLPGIARGEICFAIGMSEPEAGSDLAAIRSRGTRVEGGWRLQGRKIWTTNAHIADYMIGLFRTAPAEGKDRHKGMTQFVVDLKSPGVSVRPIISASGQHEFNEVFIDDVFVPDSHVIGQPGEGWKMVTEELAFERSGPERFLSVFPLLAMAAKELAGRAGSSAARDLGRLLVHLATLRQMSMSVAQRLEQDNQSVAIDAALIKDLGNLLEQQMPHILRAATGAAALPGHEDFMNLLAEATQAAPAFTLRGGTPQVLRGIIARALGLR